MENEKIFFIKKIAIYSAITGALGALFSLIPKLMPLFAFFLLPFFGSIPSLLALCILDKYNAEETSKWAIMGAISGGIICFIFLVIFTPSVYIIHLINKGYYSYGVQYLNFFLMILLFIMIESLFVASNAVMGILAGIITKYIKGN